MDFGNAYARTPWDCWKELHKAKLDHPAGFELKFVEEVLQQIYGLEPFNVIPQYHFKDSQGGNRYIDFVIKNDTLGYSVAIELDGLTKIQAHDRTLDYARYNDMMARQNDLLRLTGIKVLLRFTNKQAFNQTGWVIRQIQEVLRNQVMQTKQLRDEQAKQEQLKKEYESVKAAHHALIQQKDKQIQQLQQSYEQKIRELESQPPVIAWVINEPQEQQVTTDEAVVIDAVEPDLPIMPTVTPDMVGRIKSLDELSIPKQEIEQLPKDTSDVKEGKPKEGLSIRTKLLLGTVVILGLAVWVITLPAYQSNGDYHEEYPEDMSGDGTDSPYYNELTLGNLNSDNASPLIIEPAVPTTVETASADMAARAAQASGEFEKTVTSLEALSVKPPAVTITLPIPHELDELERHWERQRAVQPDTTARTENKEGEKKVSTSQRVDRDSEHTQRSMDTQQSQTMQSNHQQEKQSQAQARVDESEVQRQDRDGGY